MKTLYGGQLRRQQEVGSTVVISRWAPLLYHGVDCQCRGAQLQPGEGPCVLQSRPIDILNTLAHKS